MKLIESEQSELGAERQWAQRVPLQPHGEICRSDGTERSAPRRRAKSPAGRLRWHRRDSTAPGQAGEGWWLRAQPHSEGSAVGGESSPRPFLLRGGGAAGRAEGTALLGVLLGQCLRGVWTQRSLECRADKESWGQRVPRTLCSAGQGLPGTKLLISASTLNKWMGKISTPWSRRCSAYLCYCSPMGKKKKCHKCTYLVTQFEWLITIRSS